MHLDWFLHSLPPSQLWKNQFKSKSWPPILIKKRKLQLGPSFRENAFTQPLCVTSRHKSQSERICKTATRYVSTTLSSRLLHPVFNALLRRISLQRSFPTPEYSTLSNTLASNLPPAPFLCTSLQHFTTLLHKTARPLSASTALPASDSRPPCPQKSSLSPNFAGLQQAQLCASKTTCRNPLEVSPNISTRVYMTSIPYLYDIHTIPISYIYIIYIYRNAWNMIEKTFQFLPAQMAMGKPVGTMELNRKILLPGLWPVPRWRRQNSSLVWRQLLHELHPPDTMKRYDTIAETLIFHEDVQKREWSTVNLSLTLFIRTWQQTAASNQAVRRRTRSQSPRSWKVASGNCRIQEKEHGKTWTQGSSEQAVWSRSKHHITAKSSGIDWARSQATMAINHVSKSCDDPPSRGTPLVNQASQASFPYFKGFWNGRLFDQRVNGENTRQVLRSQVKSSHQRKDTFAL